MADAISYFICTNSNSTNDETLGNVWKAGLRPVAHGCECRWSLLLDVKLSMSPKAENFTKFAVKWGTAASHDVTYSKLVLTQECRIKELSSRTHILTALVGRLVTRCQERVHFNLNFNPPPPSPPPKQRLSRAALILSILLCLFILGWIQNIST